MRVPIADSGGRTIFGELAETHGFGHTKQKKVAYATAPGEDDEDDEEEDDEYEEEDDEDDEDEPEEGEHEHEPEADDAEDEDVEYNDEEEDPEDTEDGDEPPPERAMKGKKKPVVVRKKKRVVYATAAESGAACYPLKPKQKYKKHPMKEAAALDRAYERILREADRGEFEEVPLDPFATAGSLLREAHGEIHSAKAHRCVDKVGAKGHSESSSWAICTTSIGKGGTYAKGHGGSASPKRKIHEHGTPGQKNYPHKSGKRRDDGDDDTISRDDRHYERSRKDALAGKYTVPEEPKDGTPAGFKAAPKYGADRAEDRTGERPAHDTATISKAAVKTVKHAVTYHGADAPGGPRHAATYRGMEIHTLPSYSTPYYFVNAPGFGSVEHSPVFSRIKRQIDTFKDTGVTAQRANRAKASARYQKRKG